LEICHYRHYYLEKEKLLVCYRLRLFRLLRPVVMVLQKYPHHLTLQNLLFHLQEGFHHLRLRW
jgi:hypothetical protein